MPRIVAVALAAAVSLLSLAAPAAAQFLSFVSATGNDANTCFVQASPCKTLQRGINAAGAGGEVRLLSRLTSNGFINKSITINGAGNTVIGTLSINSASAIVTLRRLGLNGRNAFANGIRIINAAAVHIEECTTERFTGSGILIEANVSGEVSVSDSVSRDNADAGLVAFGPTTVKLTIENSLFENNATNGVYVGGGQASISNSVSSGNPSGFTLQAGAMNITGSTAAANQFDGFRVVGGEMTLKSSTARGNATGLGVDVGATATISKSTFTNNTTGVINNGTVYTLEDNTISGNPTELGGANALDTTTVNLQ